jgi:sugar transferase EpsL
MFARVLKYIADYIIAAVLLILLTPVLLILAALVKCIMGGPVLFRQRRAGMNGKFFEIVKFRSMTDARDAFGNLLPNEQRTPPFGQFLRRSSLDELPELINVLRGEMSLVGPRPLLAEFLGHYSAEQARRHDVKPGISGWAQVNGRNGLDWETKFRFDVWYVDNWSLWLDLKILVHTVATVLKREGIAAGECATDADFLRGKTSLPTETGDPARIMNLANDVIRLAGLTLGRDTGLEITSLKPGEKLYEELFMADEGVPVTQYDRIYATESAELAVETLDLYADALIEAARRGDRAEVIRFLRKFDAMKYPLIGQIDRHIKEQIEALGDIRREEDSATSQPTPALPFAA